MKLTTLQRLFILLACFATLFASCEKKEQPIQFRINQFKQTAITTHPTLVFSVQQGDEIGGDKWKPLNEPIVGFDYEEGYIYDLLVTDAEVKAAKGNGFQHTFQLRQVLSKTKAKPDDSFDIDLKLGGVKCVNGNSNTGYNILNKVNIDCGNLCSEFEQALQSNTKKLSGKFILNNNGSIKLVEILSD
ncbi:DUF4377 domain-containing protein [Pedobacter sp. KR3-3]|uniref:DUF4377 domain-containing protein n=1 Tax=Pedobacter albus TaxID=3113905 RepID=A0ABU7I2X0_9SPHI|nr:DUF4377 domain-containing protein [Pedobacter sp. KR3-3]MEE1943814.1 DUF4377 domain-containing protein [Pedobacter sp. KR3-3]